MASGKPARQELLTSWKEIAEFLGVSVRAAQKWEAQRALPVRRMPGEKGRVFADPLALDRWKKTALEKPRWWVSLRFFRVYAAAATAVALVALAILLAGYLASGHKGSPARFRHESKTLIVADEQGRELWRRTFDDPFAPGISPEVLLTWGRAWVGDLDDDGHLELLYTYEPVSKAKNGATLICFSDKGAEKWRFVPGRRVSTPTETFSPPFLISRILVAALGKDHREHVLVSSHHLALYPNQFVVLSSNGATLGEYWHSGHLPWLDMADLDGDGADEVLLAGISNAYKAATLVVLDPLNLGGSSLEEDQAYQLQGFGPGKEKARILFQRTCINRKFETYNRVLHLDVQGHSIRIETEEKPFQEAASVIYHLDRNLELISFTVSDRLRALHRELESTGQLDHPLTDSEIAQLRNLRRLK